MNTLDGVRGVAHRVEEDILLRCGASLAYIEVGQPLIEVTTLRLGKIILAYEITESVVQVEPALYNSVKCRAVHAGC